MSFKTKDGLRVSLKRLKAKKTGEVKSNVNKNKVATNETVIKGSLREKLLQNRIALKSGGSDENDYDEGLDDDYGEDYDAFDNDLEEADLEEAENRKKKMMNIDLAIDRVMQLPKGILRN